jgi:hypothetical protein
MNQEFLFLNRPMGMPLSALEAFASCRPEFQQLLAMAKNSKKDLERKRQIVRQMQVDAILKRKI